MILPLVTHETRIQRRSIYRWNLICRQNYIILYIILYIRLCWTKFENGKVFDLERLTW